MISRANSDGSYRWVVARAQPVVMYFHPWELDPDQPRLASAFGPKFYHYARLRQTEGRLRQLLGMFGFGTLRDLAASPAPVYTVAVSGSKNVVFTRL